MLKLSDYQPCAYSVSHVQLKFQLFEHETLVHSQTKFRKLTQSPLVLDGENLELLEVRLNGELLGQTNYELKKHHLKFLIDLPESFTLEIKNRLHPEQNTSLEGLYLSKGIFCTQCEPQAFRQITYFLDRPDVMSTYDVIIEADEQKYPVLLSNGDLVGSEKLSDGRHRKIWKDPTKKPSYLFALVAGSLASIQSTYTTLSGRKIQLDFYSNHGEEQRCHFAMQSLQYAMRWDEEVFGLEYELDRYMVVSIDNFNSGAMENKGLNIFNSRLVLADQTSATDEDFELIESVVAHEYFHNYSGNRVTLQDWFYLSLKEGLTVFRDQEFSADRIGRALKRIQDVELLKARQFPEDAGPQAHPVLPKQGMAMDNLFSLTIYEKGAEVIRMIQTILGQKKFREILRSYFRKFDGQAITILDFVQHFQDESGFDFQNFKNWYHIAGTPKVTVKEFYQNGTLKIIFQQLNEKAVLCPLVIPIRITARLKGKALSLPQTLTNSDGDQVYLLRRDQSEIEISGLSERPQMEYFHQFSAPVNFEDGKTTEDLIADFELQENEVNLYLIGQRIQSALLSDLYHGEAPRGLNLYVRVLFEKLKSALLPAVKAKLLEFILPEVWCQGKESIRFSDLNLACTTLPHLVAREGQLALIELWSEWSQKNIGVEYSPQNAGDRAFLFSLSRLVCEVSREQAKKFYVQCLEKHSNMTEVLRSLFFMTQYFGDDADTLRFHAEFYETWKKDQLVLTKWLKIQSQVVNAGSFPRIQSLLRHPAFNETNPNCVYAVLRTFGDSLLAFHRQETFQDVYPFYLSKMFDIDRKNPQVAARLATAFNFNKQLPDKQRDQMKQTLEQFPVEKWSTNTREKIISALNELR